MYTRRNFLKLGVNTGLAAATAPLWMDLTSSRAFGAMTAASSYKAIVLVSLTGGNDANNLLIPLDANQYNEYTAVRKNLALRATDCHVLNSLNSVTYGLHPAMNNVSARYSLGQAAIVANVGPLARPSTKQQLLANPSLVPESLLSHPAGVAQWESASALANPTSGWGGRIADLLTSQSGLLPPMLNAGLDCTFAVGQTVQGIAVQAPNGAFTPMPTSLNAAILEVANNDIGSNNRIVSQAAHLRVAAMKDQDLLAQAQSMGGSLQTVFPNSAFGNTMKVIAQVICGRSAIGASRQIFYCQQGNHDTHTYQLATQASNLRDLDEGLGAFMSSLDEMGLTNQVLVCTHSDFNRTYQPNVQGGTDHAWGSHQILLGGGIRGGRILGSMPTFELGGSSDLYSYGIWIPTTSVTQMTASIGAWMGLSQSQVSDVFPDLSHFPGAALSLV